MTIELIHNKGYHWFAQGGSFVKGYLLDDSGKTYEGLAILDYFAATNSSDDFRNRLQRASGLFSILLRRDDSYYAAVDRVRMFPLFYTTQENEIFISDDAHTLGKKTGHRLNKASVEEMNITAFVTGKNTLLKDIYQLEAGSFLTVIKGAITTDFYFEYLTDKTVSGHYPAFKKTLQKSLSKAFDNITGVIQDNFIAVPLSGGYDSRLIAVMLKELGYTDVLCYTYGRKDTPEKAAAEKTAAQLGFSWVFIEYNEALIKGYFDEKTFQDYYRFSANYTSMFFLQEYFAVRYLHQHKIVPENTIFIPGHTGDVLAGSHLHPAINEKTSLSGIAGQIYKSHYDILPASKLFKSVQINKIMASITGKDALPYLLFENWDQKERQAKYVVNSSNLYNYFGYKHVLPFWDSQLIEFFKTLPYEFKLAKKLYNEVLKSAFFEKYGLNFTHELQATEKAIRLQQMKNVIKPYLPDFYKKKLLHKKDINFYGAATQYMADDLTKNGVEIIKNYSRISSILIQWYLWRIGGRG